MSKRVKIEEDNAAGLNAGLHEEEDILKLKGDNIDGPHVWRRFQSGIKIQDLKPNYYEEVLDMIEQHFVPEDVIFRNCKFAEDSDSQKSFRERLLFNMKNQCSVIALEERRICHIEDSLASICTCDTINTTHEDLLAGVLLLKTIKKSEYGRVFSRVQLTEGKPYQSIIDFVNNLNRKIDVFEQFQCEGYLRYYLLCIKPQYRKKGAPSTKRLEGKFLMVIFLFLMFDIIRIVISGIVEYTAMIYYHFLAEVPLPLSPKISIGIGYQLLNIGYDIARHLNLPVVMGMFDCYKTQKLARRLGLQVLHEIEYVKWNDPNGELLFCDPGAGNYTCAAMAGEVPPAPEPEPLPRKIKDDEEHKEKLTRDDKRKQKKK